MTDIKNINAKHKNNKVNTVSTVVSFRRFVIRVVWNVCLTVVHFSDVTELHVHHAKGQQPHSSKDLSRCDDGTLQEKHLVSFNTYFRAVNSLDRTILCSTLTCVFASQE